MQLSCAGVGDQLAIVSKVAWRKTRYCGNILDLFLNVRLQEEKRVTLQ